MAPPSSAAAESDTLHSRERDTIPAPATSVFDDSPPWARALFVSSEETRAALVNMGEQLASFNATLGKLAYRMGALSIALSVQEHRTLQLEEHVNAPVIPLRRL